MSSEIILLLEEFELTERTRLLSVDLVCSNSPECTCGESHYTVSICLLRKLCKLNKSAHGGASQSILIDQHVNVSCFFGTENLNQSSRCDTVFTASFFYRCTSPKLTLFPLYLRE